jgi:hypothetical protein
VAAKKNAKTGTDRDSAAAAAEHGGGGAEVAGDCVQVVEYAAAIDVAKGSGWCARGFPGPGRIAGGRRCGRRGPPTRG